LWKVDLRAAKEAHVALARESVFGVQGNMPGDRYFRKKLEGRKLMRWYFPSKYNLQDFRVGEYFDMQEERFAKREAHKSIRGMQQLFPKVMERQQDLVKFFEQLDDQTLRENPTLQDLQGVLHLADPASAVAKAGDEVEHADAHLKFLALWHSLRGVLGEDERKLLEDRLLDKDSEAEVWELIADTARSKRLTHPLQAPTVVFEERHPRGDDETSPRRHQMTSYGVPPSLCTKVVAPSQGPAANNAAMDRYRSRRHRFIDPMFRRRRLKWLERQMARLNKPREVKYNDYFKTHPDDKPEFPTNKGSVTVAWPSPYH